MDSLFQILFNYLFGENSMILQALFCFFACKLSASALPVSGAKVPYCSARISAAF